MIHIVYNWGRNQSNEYYERTRSNTRQDLIPHYTSQINSIGSISNNDLYDNDSYVSNADWNIGKKPETNLKKIEFNIDVNDNEINDLNNKYAVHLKDGLDDDNNIEIEDCGVKHE